MDTQQLIPQKINTGDWVGSAWNGSPRLTPYAQAIADHYPIQVPLFLTTQMVLSNDPLDLSIPRVLLTRPQLYDTLIVGMTAYQAPTIQQAGQAYLNITHQDTGIPWTAPNSIGFSPLPAYAGMVTVGGFGSPQMFIMRLPESFFLPAHTQLKLEYLPIKLDVTPSVTIILVMQGIQLINHRPGFKTPEKVQMPNGEVIPVGSRIPWFATIPYGARPDVAGSRGFLDYALNALEQTVSYGPPSDCVIEVHDTYASFNDSTFEGFGTFNLLRTKLDFTRKKRDWSPQYIPEQAVFGSIVNIDPCMPFPMPQILSGDDKITRRAMNNDTDLENPVLDGTVTFRGVRQCEY